MKWVIGAILLLEVNMYSGGEIVPVYRDVWTISVCDSTSPHRGSQSHTFRKGSEVLVLVEGHCFYT